MGLEQVLITGSFGIAVAIVTWMLTRLREINVNKRNIQKQKRDKLELLYANLISQLKMVLRLNQSGDSISEIEKSFSETNGMRLLLANAPVNNQFEETASIIFQWSSLFKKGAPKKLRSDMAITADQDSKFKKQAEKIYPDTIKAIDTLVKLMREHLVET